MAEITAALVKDLREKTGAGMMECKKALTEANGDLDAAIDYLRKKGLSVAAKKANRIASQGLVGVKSNGKKGAIIELNSETDFVAKNDEFQKLASCILDAAVDNGDLEVVKKAPLNGKSIADNLTDLIAKIGENMTLRRTDSLSVGKGVVASYIHNATAPNLGKIGVLVALESDADPVKLQEIAKQIAMHIAATAPQALDIDSLDKNAVEHERSIYSEQAKASGKPDHIIEKMVEGRIRKFYEEVVLLEQAYIMDPDKKVKDIINEASKELAAPVHLKAYVRFALGEGIEKKQEDFAAEVNAQLNK